MQLETVFLRYIPIFNWLGESRIMTSDFYLTNPLPKERRLTNILLFVSLFTMIILSAYNATVYIKYNPEDSTTAHIVYLMLFIFRTNTKMSSVSHFRSWFNYLPKLYTHIKDIQRVSESRYKMDFRHFQMQFDHDVSIVLVIWLIKMIIYFLDYSEPIHHGVIFTNESIVLFFNYIIFFHAYFYVLLFKTVSSFYIDYVERKSLFDKPKSLAELKVELIFIKIMNFKLYETAKVLNAAFGWIFVCMFIQKFGEIVGNAFWTYCNLNCENIFDVTRNYNSFDYF